MIEYLQKKVRSMFDTGIYEVKMDNALEHFSEELKKVRTGRAHPDMLSGVMVEAYGTKMPLNQVANVTAPEPGMLLVSPFDPGTIAQIAAGIREDQSLGFNPSDDGRVVRVPVPTLTEERRREMVKQLAEKVESARIALRNIRQDAFRDAKRRKEAKELSEDDVRAVEKAFDKLMQAYQAKLDDIFKVKEKEILTI
ncbi:Ribosome-recycling factor [Candidatus Saccharibacteria bacterium RAAC3_TM7_1]|nr:Ribosome-recycling factor [Candidatus Saccharibacteria bacterium RAAC3_TM7_1]HCZ28440.1 ribosome recycling factor [Candidatus Saccharibacteria bacterium]